ncbi:MAG: hypothetical protein H8E38_03740 [SAR324 cluster bacterium]|nr:hypothetical protein [SAR324 cluster bacterium]
MWFGTGKYLGSGYLVNDNDFPIVPKSFPRSAWECLADALRPMLHRRSGAVCIPTQSVGTISSSYKITTTKI